MAVVIVNGRDLMLFAMIGGAKKALAASTSCSMVINSLITPVSNKDSGQWEENEVTGFNFSMNAEAMFVMASFDDLFEAQIAGIPIDAEFSLAAEPTSDPVPALGWTPKAGGYKGKVVIASLNNTAPLTGKATCSVSLTGTGKLEKGVA